VAPIENGYFVRVFFPFGGSDRERSMALVEHLASTKYFMPTHIGVDERKRKPFSKEALEVAFESLARDWSSPVESLFIWHLGGSRGPDPLTLGGAPPSSLEMRFFGAKADGAGESIYREFETIVERFDATMGRFTFTSDEVVSDESLRVYADSNSREPSNPTQVYFCGFGALSIATFLNEELGERLQPALSELGAERLPNGSWKLLIDTSPWEAKRPEVDQWHKSTADVLRKHGLQGRVTSGKFHPAPRWRRPESWTGINLVWERKVSTPNE